MENTAWHMGKAGNALVHCVALGKLFYLPIAAASSEPAMKSVPTPQRGCGASRGVFLEGWMVLSHQPLAPAPTSAFPLQNLRVRSTGGTEFFTRSATKFKGVLAQKFMFVDGDRAMCGSYR